MAVEVGDDVVELLHNLWVVRRLATNVSKRFGGFGDAVLLDEPARTLCEALAE